MSKNFGSALESWETYEGRKPIFFDKTGFLPSYSPLSQKNDQRGDPLESPVNQIWDFCLRDWGRF